MINPHNLALYNTGDFLIVKHDNEKLVTLALYETSHSWRFDLVAPLFLLKGILEEVKFQGFISQLHYTLYETGVYGTEWTLEATTDSIRFQSTQGEHIFLTFDKANFIAYLSIILGE